MNFIRMTALSALLACGVCSATPSNMIVNGSFDQGVTGWTADTTMTSFWRDAAQDAEGSASSGALAMSTANGMNGNLSVKQCIGSLAGGSDYSFGIKIKANTSSTYGMTCSAHASTDCSGASLGSANAAQGATDANNWIAFRTTTPFVLPASTQSVSCAITSVQPLRQPLGAQQPNGNYPVAIWADGVFFSPGTTPVSLQSFNVD
ncbi:hypothetical protein [Dokdonella soli]|uniref:CBM-cenC domain-containing protein n=2 Tax=Dokdonella soli TaxID=529810 RepID=A0ABN1IDJ5_9GAMM